MLKNQICLFSFVLLSFNSALYAQKQEFMGTLKADGIEAITIKLIFEIAEDGTIEGKSITDFNGTDETTSSLIGKLNRNQKTLQFREIANLSTRADTAEADFCYISAQTLEITRIEDKNMIIGPFQGVFANGEFCAEGEIHIVGPNILEKDKAPPEKPKSNLDLDSSRMKGDPIATVDLSQPIGDGTKVPLKWETDSIRLDLWDTFEEDNDQVSIYHNGLLIKKNLAIKKYRQSFYFPVGEACIIRIKADNEGSNPPNTVNAILSGGTQKQALVTKLKAGESVELEISKNAQ